MMDTDLDPVATAAIAAWAHARPTAHKTGRRPAYPWVPIIDHGEQATGAHATRTEQVLGLAYATRTEAVDAAARAILAGIAALDSKLRTPRYRALRLAHGLPADLDQR